MIRIFAASDSEPDVVGWAVSTVEEVVTSLRCIDAHRV
jgi:hypothetical protein